MRRLSPSAQRQVAGWGCFAVLAVFVYWNYFTDGFPILWGPSASAAEIAAGRELFEHEWTANDPQAHGDGLGPVFNARSCAACHFQGGLGGGGGLEHNARGFEVLPRPNDPTFLSGTIHNFSIADSQHESLSLLKAMYPIIPGRTIREQRTSMGDCSYTNTITIPDFDPVRVQSVQPTALFGAGWVDLISDRAILRNARNRTVGAIAREIVAEFDDIPVGRVGMVKGGVGKFGWKGQFATLEEFVAAACANELGLGTPTTEQARPLKGEASPCPPDLDRKQFRSLVAFIKTLPRPVEAVPEPAADRDAARRGKEVFTSVGCAVCHVPDLGGVKRVYSDFLLYSLEDPNPQGGGEYDSPPAQLQLPDRPADDPRPSEWKTPALWGVADSAPYLHDGSAPTLREAIQRHNGAAKSVLKKFQQLPATDQAALLSFLGALKAPPDAIPLADLSVTKLARR
jgi:CxxC motif-containing protein (DUF1111 family)